MIRFTIRHKKSTMIAGAIAAVIALASCAHTGAEGVSDGGGALSGVVSFYTGPLDHLSAVRGGTCPMLPSCSQYSAQAIKKYGPAKGWLMTMDRLIRCGRQDLEYAPKVWTAEGMRYFDPVENNALWAQSDRAR